MDFSVLSRYDDILASYFVDSLYLWYDTLRMNGDFVRIKVDKNEAVNRIRQHVVGESFTNKAVKDAAESFLNLPYFKEFVQGLPPKQVTEFTQHMKRYLFMYRPNAGFEVGSTTRYTGKPEACLLATKNWKAGEQVTCCLGSIAALSEQDDLKLKREGRDFSVMVSTRKKCSCLFLGPARFMNHDCDSNCEFILIGQNAITFRVQKDITVGEEMTVFYAEHYFGENNCECLCSSCERKKQGHFSASDENTTTDTSDSDITIDENATRRSGRKRKDISYKDYYVPEQVKRTRPETALLVDTTSNIKPVVMQKKRLFYEKDFDLFPISNNIKTDLSILNDWIDSLSDVSDDEQEEVVLKCCPQAKQYCMSRVSERPDLCGRCNRHFQIYGLIWPLRKVKKLSWRSKKFKAALKNNSPSAQVVPPTVHKKPTQPIPIIQPTVPVQAEMPIKDILPIQSILPTQSIHPMQSILPMPAHPIQTFSLMQSSQMASSVIPMQYMQHTIQRILQPTPQSITQHYIQSTEPFISQTFPQASAQSIMQYTEGTQSIKPQSAKPQSSKPQSVKPHAKPKRARPQPRPRSQPSLPLEPQHAYSIDYEPIVISAWPLDKSIPKIHTNNLTVEQLKRERALAIKLKKKTRPRKESYKLVGLDAELKEKQERLGGLELQNIHLLDLKKSLKEMISKQRTVVDTQNLPMLQVGINHDRHVLKASKSESSARSFSTCSVDETMYCPGEFTDRNVDVHDADNNPIEQEVFTEKMVTVKLEPLELLILEDTENNHDFNEMPQTSEISRRDHVITDQMIEENTYHPLDTSRNAKIVHGVRLHEYNRNSSDRIVFRGPETSTLVEEERSIKQEPERMMFSPSIFLDNISPSSPSPPPLELSPLQQSPPLPPLSPQQQSEQQSPMKVSFLLQPTNESPKPQRQCVFKTANIKLKLPRKKSTRKGCPIAPPRKEQFTPSPLPLVFRNKFRDAPPPRMIPVVPAKETTKGCSTNSSIGPFVPIEPNNC